MACQGFRWMRAKKAAEMTMAHIGFIGYQHEKDNNTKMKQDGWGVDVDGRNIIFGLYYSF